MKINSQTYLYLSIFCLLTWFAFIGYAIFDIWQLSSELSTFEAYRQSRFTRIMFMDIGAISTVVAVWMVLFTDYRFRYICGLLTLALGSTFALPFISYHLYVLHSSEV